MKRRLRGRPIRTFKASDLPLPPATRARPGSLEKILVMQERMAQGKQLHHPQDERLSIRRIKGRPIEATSEPSSVSA